MNKNKIREMLAAAGIVGVTNRLRLAAALKISPRTVSDAKTKGELKQVDRGTYSVDGIVEWLFANPRYLSRLCANQTNQQ